MRKLGRAIGPNVVVFVGYNDDPATYRHGLPTVVKAMWKRGVQHMLWLTLHAVSKQYVDTNHAIYAAQQKWRPTMTVLDWNHYSASHCSWYASDGIHMTAPGRSRSRPISTGAEAARPDRAEAGRANRRSPAGAGLLRSRPVSRILSRVTIHLCGYPAPRRAASAEPVRLAPDGV